MKKMMKNLLIYLELFLFILSMRQPIQALSPSSNNRGAMMRRCENRIDSPSKYYMSKPSEVDQNSCRRRFIFSSLAPFSVVSVSNAADDNRLFRPNPLTNPILEQIRILEQAEADNIKYGGELAPGSPKGQEGYAKLLVPILQIQKDLIDVDKLVHVQDGDGLIDALQILNKSQFDKLQFKKIFNAFADNIYYSDPDRANAYLGGGAVPRNEQSIAYLIRNDILTNLENLQAEVSYLIKEKNAGNNLETEDLYLYSDSCNSGMVKYLELVPPTEIKLAKEIFGSMP